MPIASGATPGDEGEAPYLRFAADAQVEFDAWRAALETRLRTEDLHPALETVLAKHRSLVPSLALLIHLVDAPDGGPVSHTALLKACGWCEYLESHARRLYGARMTPALLGALNLARKLRRGALPEPFSLRDVYRPGWSRLTTVEAAQAAVNILLDHDWLRALAEPPPPGGGRPRTTYVINPKIRPEG